MCFVDTDDDAVANFLSRAAEAEEGQPCVWIAKYVNCLEYDTEVKVVGQSRESTVYKKKFTLAARDLSLSGDALS